MRLDPRRPKQAIAPLAAEAGPVPARDGARHRAHRQRQHDARDPGGVDRARPRSARLHADAVRRRGRAARRGDRARAWHPRASSCRAAPGILCAEGVAAAELEESFVATCRVAARWRSGARGRRLRPADRRGPAMACARAPGRRGRSGRTSPSTCATSARTSSWRSRYRRARGFPPAAWLKQRVPGGASAQIRSP